MFANILFALTLLTSSAVGLLPLSFDVFNQLAIDYKLTGSSNMVVRGGVEDTRLEAKDTKKIRGLDQGQPFREQ